MMSMPETSSGDRRLRGIVLGLAGLETVAMIALLATLSASGNLFSSEMLSRSLGWAVLLIYGLPWLLLVLPALVLGVSGRRLPLALGMCIAAIPIALLVARSA